MKTTQSNLTLTAAAAHIAGTLHTRNTLPPSSDSPTSPDAATSILLDLTHRLLPHIPNQHRATTAIFLATTADSLAADTEFDHSRGEANARYASPAAFSRTLPSTPTSELSVKLQLAGPALTFCTSQADAFPTALARTRTWLRHTPYLTRSLTAIVDASSASVNGAARVAVLLCSRTPSSKALPELSSFEQLLAWINSCEP